ncbi:MAG: prepilin-type N-terminal cleavage/methylation domain-containing protein [Gammaproteobacteria bacterium]|nr:prepilin-type N-terminal cleavage/methylation domain-containing protein [Gammaproteobacteria bacterium]
MTARGGQRGFTLIELLIALVLVAMVSLLLGGSLRLGSQSWRKVNEAQDHAEHEFLLAQTLRRHLANARFVSMQTSAGNTVNGFIGGPERATFIAPYPSFDNAGVLYWWTLEVAPDETTGDDALRLSYVRYDPDQAVVVRGDGSITVTQNYAQNGLTATSQLEPEHITIASDIDAIALGYFYRDAADEGHWVQEWDPTDEEFSAATPELIRLRISRTDAQRKPVALPEITVMPRLVEQRLYARLLQ